MFYPGYVVATAYPAVWVQPPCLPTNAQRPSSGTMWLHEIKHDGFIAHKDGDRARLYSRPGNDLTYRFRRGPGPAARAGHGGRRLVAGVGPPLIILAAWHTHQAVAEALHIELAFVASPVCGFGHLPADQLATVPRERCVVMLLRGVRWSRQCGERKHQHTGLHFFLQVLRSLKRD